MDISFTPIDNARLANLCGALDANLRQIETALDVSIGRRGENFTLHGKPKQMQLAAAALRTFYDLAVNALDIEDIQLGLVEAIHQPADECGHGLPVPGRTL